MNKIEIQTIGYIKCPELSNDELKGQNHVSKIEINNALAEGLKGIEEFSHIYIIFWMNKISKTSLKAPFSEDPEKPSVGIFATRAPIHPNPIGLSLVEILKVEKNTIWVKGLDAYNNTPVLDIKPYPYWSDKKLQVVKDFNIPKWLQKITGNQ